MIIYVIYDCYFDGEYLHKRTMMVTNNKLQADECFNQKVFGKWNWIEMESWDIDSQDVLSVDVNGDKV